MRFGVATAASLVGVVAATTPGLLRGTSSESYSEATAKDLAVRAGIGYCDLTEVGPWTCDPCTSHPVAAPVFTFSSDSEHTQGYATRLPDGSPFVAFRGPVGDDIIDWLESEGNFTFVAPYQDCVECKAHKGFYDAYMSIQEEMYLALAELGVAKNEKIVVAGHSLGGAIATLAMKNLYDEGYALGTSYTFGQPRPVNQGFVDFWRENLGTDALYRVVHYRDIIVQIPFEFMGYRNFPKEVYYNEDMTSYRLCNGSGEDKDCSDGHGPDVSITDNLQYFGVNLTELCPGAGGL